MIGVGRPREAGELASGAACEYVRSGQGDRCSGLEPPHPQPEVVSYLLVEGPGELSADGILGRSLRFALGAGRGFSRPSELPGPVPIPAGTRSRHLTVIVIFFE